MISLAHDQIYGSDSLWHIGGLIIWLYSEVRRRSTTQVWRYAAKQKAQCGGTQHNGRRSAGVRRATEGTGAEVRSTAEGTGEEVRNTTEGVGAEGHSAAKGAGVEVR